MFDVTYDVFTFFLYICVLNIYLNISCIDLQQILSLTKSSGFTKQGLSAGVVSQSQNLIQLNDVSLFAKGHEPFRLNGPLNAIVTDFPQEQ